MRPDQYSKLQDLSARLVDVFVQEAEPENWPGHDVLPAEMDQQTRGDRYWCKKNAVATLSLICRMDNLAHTSKTPAGAGLGNDDPASENLLDAEIKAAEKDATKLLDSLQRTTKKAAFDRHVHGKS
jgi:hypothetical protein